MKHLARFLLLSALLAACGALAAAQDPKPQGEFVTDRPWPEYIPESWKEFSSKEGRFKVLLPGVPKEEVQTVDSPYGKLEMHGFILQTLGRYVVVYADYPEKDGIRDVNAFFNGVQAGNLAGAKAELIEAKNDYRFAYPGRFIKMRLQSGHVARTRLHLIRNRYYMLWVLMPEKGTNAETLKFYEGAAMKFLDSFEPERPALNANDRFGDPKGINLDPVNPKPLPLSRKGEPEPPAKVDGGNLNAKARRLLAPELPENREGHASGYVTVKVVVDESGKVIWALAVSGHPLLHAAAEAAAYKAEFEPTVVEGKPEKVRGVLVYNFAGEK